MVSCTCSEQFQVRLSLVINKYEDTYCILAGKLNIQLPFDILEQNKVNLLGDWFSFSP